MAFDLQDIRDRRDLAEREFAEIKEEGRKDKLCASGDVWEAMDPAGKKKRHDPEVKRPVLDSDEINQYLNQAINGVRANPRSIKYAPTGNGANDKGAEFYQNHTREIEYRSHAQMAYSTAFQDAVTSGLGWLRIRRKREHIRTMNQELWIEPIVNADQVLPDPYAVWPDSRDQKFLLYLEPWAVSDVTKKWKGSKVKSFTAADRALYKGWIDKEQIILAEYWALEPYRRTLLAWRPGPGIPEQFTLEDELPEGRLPPGAELARTDTVEEMRVEACLTNGLEILEEIPWKGTHIPFVSCMGKQMWLEGKRQILSLTRLARSPAMRHCYFVTCEAEAVGGIPRSAYVGYTGQFAKPELWAKSAHEPVIYLEVHPTVEGAPATEVLPLPRKEPWDPPLQNLELAIDTARRAIQAAMGIMPQSTPQQEQQDQRSGKAHDKIESGSQRGSFHFNDNYKLMIERTGIILEEQIEIVIDTKRDVPVREEIEGAGKIQRVNDPNDPESVFTKGNYRVTVSDGPATESQRVEAADFVDSMLSGLGEIAQIAGPQAAKVILAKSVKLKQLGPIGDEIVQLLDPPPPNGPNGKPLAPEAQALMGQIQQLTQQLQQAQQELQTKQLEYQNKIQLKDMDLAFDREKLASDRETKLAVAELSAKVDRMALFLQERERLGLHASSIQDQLHEAREGVKDRLHEVSMHALEHHTDTAKAEQAHQHAKELGDQGLAGQLTVQANQPPPNGRGEGE